MNFFKQLFRLSNDATDGLDNYKNNVKYQSDFRFQIVHFPITGRYYVKDGNDYLGSTLSFSGIISITKNIMLAQGFQNYSDAIKHLTKYKEQQGLLIIEIVYAE